jgi:hypothetical protein
MIVADDLDLLKATITKDQTLDDGCFDEGRAMFAVAGHGHHPDLILSIFEECPWLSHLLALHVDLLLTLGCG